MRISKCREIPNSQQSLNSFKLKTVLETRSKETSPRKLNCPIKKRKRKFNRTHITRPIHK